MVKIIPAIIYAERGPNRLFKNIKEKIDFLWETCNIDFYGNIRLGGEKRDISPGEVKESLQTVEKVILEIEKLME